MIDETQRAAFEAWRSKQPWLVVCEGQELYALMNHAAESSWQAATAQATAAERERCAKVCEKLSSRRRIIAAGANQNPIAPCEFADAIRKGEVTASGTDPVEVAR